jgi:hypothetical protein
MRVRNPFVRIDGGCLYCHADAGERCRADCPTWTSDEPSYTCPRCNMTSYNPNDIRYRYCGNCHQFETRP